jgi:hypothetical protein
MVGDRQGFGSLLITQRTVVLTAAEDALPACTTSPRGIAQHLLVDSCGPLSAGHVSARYTLGIE